MRITLRLIVTTVLLASCLLSASPALAVLPPDISTLTVDTTNDSNAPAYQACTPQAVDCSLRSAISRANADADSADACHIVRDAETYALRSGGDRQVSMLPEIWT